jgi:hypothetical protein
MRIAHKVPFVLTTILLLALGWLAWEWTRGVTITSFFGGYVFTATFTYAGGAGDSFQVGVNKMFLVAIILTAVLLPAIALCGVVTHLKTTVQKWAFLILSLALCIFPFSALGIAVVALTRYILDMGLTIARVEGVICGIAGILFIAAFLVLLAKFIPKTPRKSEL